MSILRSHGTEKISLTELVEEGASLHHMLSDLYRSQLALDPNDQYLIEHGSYRNIANHVLTFLSYLPYLPKEGAVLDWGCSHAPELPAAYDLRPTVTITRLRFRE